MTYIFPSREWVDVLCLSLNSDRDFLNAINGWKIDLLLVGRNLSPNVINYLQRTYGVNRVDTVGIFLKFNNSCNEASFIINPDVGSYDYVVIADYDVWLKVLSGLSDPVTTMLSVFRKLEVRGSMVTLVRLAANIVSPMARVIMRIPTEIIR
ncbi:SCP2 sterol-binding domain-containing protein [Vulcanisaeta distributa]|uniref:SCP2 domain-containing protein n=1 Tax=Vulcanisaeta distributa (strain DSM 14429 / JCM 11212 / NBRC 100878 / IC-017) TaxID=572478 RepID=E1QSJ8_VULDI|nr:hypothetical protein [Vulcanisaeta distributa]ADN50791.1 hypothetical protein Vdis_1405 [Vulcanisaeta distributa DSM 14429]